ncbi:hypothetical protein H0H87_010907 [Tephrocybe sp. NHM501043]|nr:hypothetical protein H0H87_010907 [Tephrocybe sp. NHM501043]
MIASRTEQDIHQPFMETLSDKHVKQLHLHTPDSVTEVGNYLRTRLNQVAQKYGLSPDFWPGADRADHLAKQADGLYIWAVTVTQFLDTRLRREGKINPLGIIDQLKLPDKADINVLYQQILELTYNETDTTEQDLETFHQIVGAILVARELLSIGQIDDLLDPHYSGGRVDVLNFIKLLRTVLVSGMESVSETTIIRVHRSFFEFATANSGTRFRINLERANAEMTLCCLKHLARSYAIVASTQFASSAADIRELPHATRYALSFCLSHKPLQLGIVLDQSDISLSQFNAWFLNPVARNRSA